MFNCVVKFVNHPPNHLPQFFSSFHFIRLLSFNSYLLPYHLLAIGSTSFLHSCVIIFWVILLPFLFDGFDLFFCFPSIASSSFNVSSTFAIEVDLWCFASYLANNCYPWSVLNEHTCLMIISTTNFWSCSLSIFVWLLIDKWEVDFS